jgi:hypothetical protein
VSGVIVVSLFTLGVLAGDAGVPSPPPADAATLKATAPRAPGFCELSGRVGEDGLEISGAAYGRPLARVTGGRATLSFSDGGPVFAEARLPSSAVVRGPLRARIFRGLRGERLALATVHARRWLAFAGVFHVGAGARMLVANARDGKLTVVPFDGIRGFQFLDAAPQLDLPCADLSLDPDADGTLHHSAPPAFLPAPGATARPMWLGPAKSARISADADGPPAGMLTAGDDEPLRVVVLEQRGPRARIRYGHVTGWTDAALLDAKAPKKPKAAAGRPALREAVQFGMLGLLVPDESAESPERKASRPALPDTSERLSCAAAVRIVAELRRPAGSPRTVAAPPARFVVGEIPAGQPFRVIEHGAEVSYLGAGEATAAVSPTADARLAVATTDLTTGCAQAAGDLTIPPAADRAKVATAGRKADAVDALDKGPASDAQLDPFGLSGPGVRPLEERAPRNLTLANIQISPTTSALMAGPGHLHPEVIDRVLRQHASQLTRCYDAGLRTDPDLAGRVTARFTIEASGSVSNVSDSGSDLPGADTVKCVLGVFQPLTFPRPENGSLTVTVPLLLTTY